MKKLIGCILMMAATLYIAVMYSPVWLANILAAEIIFVSVGALLCLIFRFGIRVSLKTPVPVTEKGGKAEVYIHIQNKLILPVPKVTVTVVIYKNGQKQKEKKTVWAAVDARKETVVPLKIDCDLCGFVQIQIQKSKVTDYFRLLSSTKRLDIRKEISVLPRLLPAAAEVVSSFRYFYGDSDVYADDRSGDDVSQIFEIRPYRAGDKMQKIHWKLSAKSDEMMVREYSDPVGYAIVIFLNLYTDGTYDEKHRDAALEAAAALSWTLLQLEYTHIVSWVGERGRLIRYKMAETGNIYEMLAEAVKAKPHSFMRPASALYNEKYGAASYHTFVEVNMKPEVILREDEHLPLSADKLEESLLTLNMEI